MKKVFTFLFFAGLMTSAMAQNSRNAQHRGQTGGNNQPAGYSNNGQNNGYQQNNSHQNDQAYSNRNESSYGYGNDKRKDDRRFDDRNSNRRYRDNDHFGQRAYGYNRRVESDRYSRGSKPAFSISIRFGQPSCF